MHKFLYLTHGAVFAIGWVYSEQIISFINSIFN